MMYDPEYVEMFEAMVVDDRDEKENQRSAIDNTSAGTQPQLPLDEAIRRFCSQAGTRPEPTARRAGVGDVSIHTVQPAVTPSSEVPPTSEVVSDNQLLEPPALEMLKEWAVKMFNDPEGKVIDLPMLGRKYQETNGLIVNAKQAIFELFGTKDFKSALCRSPERDDLKLSQEEALGWLLAHTRGRRLLELEARPIGKYAGTQVTAAKKELDRIRDAAKVARCKARKKPASDEALAAIDTKAAQDRAAITEAPFLLKHMPAANTVIVERRTPKASAICPGCTRSLRSADPPTPLQARFGTPCGCAWGPDEDDVPDEPQPSSKGAVARAQAELERYSGREVGRAVAIVDQLENLYMWLEEGEPVTDEQIEAQKQQYRLALGRLKAVAPASLLDANVRPLALETVEPRMADEHNSIACPYGFGRIARWPWTLHLPPLGFCDHFCHCGVIREARDRVVTASLGAWPKDVQIRKIW